MMPLVDSFVPAPVDRSLVRKKVVFASQAKQRRPRLMAIFRTCAKLVNAAQLSREKATLEIKSFLIHVATKFWWL
jgi:hypothetical protein